MRRALGSLAPGSWLRLPGHTARLRLTLLYAGMFLLLGTAVILITYLLTSSSSTIHVPRGVPTSVLAHNGAAHQHSADARRLLAVSWLALAVTTVFSTLLGWLISGRVLRPLREMTATARTISAGNLSERLALTGPDDEFKALGDTLDTCSHGSRRPSRPSAGSSPTRHTS